MKDREKELSHAAFIFLKQLMGLKEGEKILLYGDGSSDYSVAEAVQISAEQQIGAVAEVFKLNAGLSFYDMARELTGKIEAGKFDAICELSEQYFYQTSAWKRALEKDARLFSLSGIDADAFIRCIGKVNHDSMFKFGTALKGLLGEAKHIQILTNKGTNIRFRMDVKPPFPLISMFKKKERSRQKPYIMDPAGLLTPDVQATFMGGQLSFLGDPDSIEGTAVVDGYMWPPEEIGRINEPIILKIKNGRVVKIDGCPSTSGLLRQWIKGKSTDIEHFCFGFNPRAALSGGILEAERAFGLITIGIGSSPFHTDAIIMNPTISINNEVIEQDGSFVQTELSILEQSLLKSS